MNRFLLYLLAASALCPNLLQGQCLTNGDFSQDASCVMTTTCSTFGTCNGWTKAQGTPQILPFTYTTPKSGTIQLTSYFAYMWGTSNNGEGMFTPYTFQPHHSYDVRLFFIGSGGNGGVVVKAANGLTALTTGDACGSATPTNINSQPIGEYDGVAATQVDKTFSFTANNNYLQLWVYAQGVSSDITSKYNLNLYHIYACPSCTALLIYNSGTIPSGESAAGTIDAGSSAGTGGSGTVSVPTGQSSTLTAANEIDLLPSFQASVTGSASFIAQIVPCDPASTVSIESTPLDSAIITVLSAPIETNTINKPTTTGQASPFDNGQSMTRLQVYPTAGSGAVTITGSLSDLENADITVSDEAGRNVFRSHNAVSTTIQLDLGNLNNGLYFLQIRQGTRITNQKIIIYR